MIPDSSSSYSQLVAIVFVFVCPWSDTTAWKKSLHSGQLSNSPPPKKNTASEIVDDSKVIARP